MNQKRILVLGAAGQIGVELVLALREKYGQDNVIASDISAEPHILEQTGPWLTINTLHSGAVHSTIVKYQISEVYLLAAMLSATGEKRPLDAWHLNMQSLLNLLEIAREEKIKLFWPSSIAAAAPNSTVYGISKSCGENWCKYYFEKYGVDVRSIRYPGLISWKSQPGGGTTDYAIDIFHSAIDNKKYHCFLSADTRLPMLYMPDAISATILLMESPGEKISNRLGYDLSSFSFSPKELFQQIKLVNPVFDIEYHPDSRQGIADSWPTSCDGTIALKDFGFNMQWDLPGMVNDMLKNIAETKKHTKKYAMEKIGVA